MATPAIDVWLKDAKVNKEYFEVDADAEAVPAGSCAISVGGMFTFFLKTSAPFTITLPPRVASSKALTAFAAKSNQTRSINVAAALKTATQMYVAVADDRDAEVCNEDEGAYADAAVVFEAALAPPNEAQKKKAAMEAAVRDLRAKYEATSARALPGPTITRLVKDLQEIQESKPIGWSADPLEGNLATWKVTLHSFEKDTPLFSDMQMYAKTHGESCVTMRMVFPKEYPVRPPFIRVVRPRFQFHTGRVTVGGSICTELLVDEGWKPIYSIESIMETIRQQIVDPKSGARIDLNNSTEYTEAEAIEAFNRVADHHRKVGW